MNDQMYNESVLQIIYSAAARKQRVDMMPGG